MTGCKDLQDANLVINKLIYKLKEVLMIKNELQEDQDLNLIQEVKEVFTEIKFVVNADNIAVTKFKIDLINSNFGINY